MPFQTGDQFSNVFLGVNQSGTRFRPKNLHMCIVFPHKTFLAGRHVISGRANWQRKYN